MLKRRMASAAICLCAVSAGEWLTGAQPAEAVINAGLQPYDLMQFRYRHVFALEVQRVDAQAGVVHARIRQVFKGEHQPGETIALSMTGDLKGYAELDVFKPGRPIVALVGRSRRAGDLMIYADGFFLGQVSKPGQWTLDKTSEDTVGIDGQTISTLAGTWNGATSQLVRLYEDIAAGRDHFPRKAYARFRPDLLLDDVGEPIRSIAVYDIEGDGDQDILACTDHQVRVYLQADDAFGFVDATERLGLQAAEPAASVSFGDYNADFLSDVLIGGVLYQGRFEHNRFTLVRVDPWSGQAAFPGVETVKQAAFVELNGDGFPDVLVTYHDRGPAAFVNQAGERFEDVTQAAGLADAGLPADGFASLGDWNGDLRADLFYAAGGGHLLVQNQQGVFQSVPHDVGYKFTSGFAGETGLTGGGVFMPLLSPDRIDLLTPIEDGWLTVANRAGKPVDITSWGNEISEGSNRHLASAAADLNLDGHLDFYTISNEPNGHNRFIVNRGYGSFMLASVHRHYEHMFAGPAHQRGGTALSIGDLDLDGAPDIVVGNQHGQITLLMNDTWEVRKPIPNAPREIKLLEETRAVTARVIGSKGVINAKVELFDAHGQRVGRQDLGTLIGGGNWGPMSAIMAARAPGKYQLKVTYADGLERVEQVDLTKEQHVLVDVDRGPEDHDHGW